jgi:hypothetical protein
MISWDNLTNALRWSSARKKNFKDNEINCLSASWKIMTITK